MKTVIVCSGPGQGGLQKGKLPWVPVTCEVGGVLREFLPLQADRSSDSGITTPVSLALDQRSQNQESRREVQFLVNYLVPSHISSLYMQ